MPETSPASGAAPFPAEEPCISVVIPAYNRDRSIAACLKSVLDQEVSCPFEVIVVDNGSSDGTVQVAQSHPGVSVYVESKRGPGAARNHGVRRSRSDLIAFLDSDDMMLPARLQAQLDYMRANPDVVLCFGAVTRSSNPGRAYLSFSHQATDWQRIDDPYREILVTGGEVVNTMTVMVRRQAFLNAGGFDESLMCGEDTDLWLRLGRGGTFAFHPRPLCLVEDEDASRLTKSGHIYRDGPMVIVDAVASNLALEGQDRRRAVQIARKSSKMMLGHLWRKGDRAAYAQRRATLRRAFGRRYVLFWNLVFLLPSAVGGFVHQLMVSARAANRR